MTLSLFLLPLTTTLQGSKVKLLLLVPLSPKLDCTKISFSDRSLGLKGEGGGGGDYTAEGKISVLPKINHANCVSSFTRDHEFGM